MEDMGTMRTKGLLWSAVVAAVVLLGAAPAGAFVPEETDARQDDDFDRADLDRNWISISETPIAYQYSVLRKIREYVALRGAEGYPWQADVTYNNDRVGRKDKDTWVMTLAYERPVSDTWGWGIQSVEQYGDVYHDKALWYEGVTGYSYYDATPAIRVGGYVNLNYAWSDLRNVDNELSYGVGAFGSYKAQVSDKVIITPAVLYQYYNARQNRFDDSSVLSVGARADFGITDKLWANGELFYNAEGTNGSVDDSFLDWQVGLSYRVTAGWDLYAWYGTTESFESFDRKSFTVGVKATF